jgi:hypothetical protein
MLGFNIGRCASDQRAYNAVLSEVVYVDLRDGRIDGPHEPVR